MHRSSNEKYDARLALLEAWLGKLGLDTNTLRPASTDASARRYYRLDSARGTLIAVDSPPEKEDNATFLGIARELSKGKIRVPAQYAADLDLGFLLMEDFGNTTLQSAIDEGDQDSWYQSAVTVLAKIHGLPTQARTPYDRTLIERELTVFTTHYLGAFGAKLTAQQSAAWTEFINWVCAAFATPDWVWTHRDFHSRNLMALPNQRLGVIDFQGALCAPRAYDLVSLLRDCYIDLPESTVSNALTRYANAAGLASPEPLRESMDILGMQRHLKCLGAFVRFDREQGKPDYLKALPRTAAYIKTAAATYPQADIVAGLLHQYPAEALM